MFYSGKTNSFYSAELRGAYDRAGTWPTDAIAVTNDEWETYGKSEPPAGMRRGSGADGRPNWIPVAAPDLSTLAAEKKNIINASRNAAFTAGLEFEFDNELDVVQIRPADKPNLLAIAIEARDLKAVGESNPVIDFRAESNTTYQLTPSQAIDMTNAALAHVKSIYEKSWQLKDVVDAALVAGDREGIEAVNW